MITSLIILIDASRKSLAETRKRRLGQALSQWLGMAILTDDYEWFPEDKYLKCILH